MDRHEKRVICGCRGVNFFSSRGNKNLVARSTLRGVGEYNDKENLFLLAFIVFNRIFAFMYNFLRINNGFSQRFIIFASKFNIIKSYSNAKSNQSSCC